MCWCFANRIQDSGSNGGGYGIQGNFSNTPNSDGIVWRQGFDGLDIDARGISNRGNEIAIEICGQECTIPNWKIFGQHKSCRHDCTTFDLTQIRVRHEYRAAGRQNGNMTDA